MSAISMLTGVKTGKDLDIEKLTSNLHMAPDGIRAANFLAVVPTLGQLVGAGTIDSKNNLDFKMVATLASAAAAPAGAASGSTNAPGSGLGGILTQVTGAAGGCKGGGTSVPFLIHGTASDPKFIPDVGGLAAGLLKSQLGCAGTSAAGSTKSLAQGQNPADAISALGGLFKKKKP